MPPRTTCMAFARCVMRAVRVREKATVRMSATVQAAMEITRRMFWMLRIREACSLSYSQR